MNSPLQQGYEFGPFQLDTANHCLLREGQLVPLTPKVFDLLEVLVQNNGRLIEKEELLKEVWPDSFVEEGNVNRNISIIRKVLGEDASGKPYIETVPKRGYRFVASVRTMAGNGLKAIETEQVERDSQKDEPLRVTPRGNDEARRTLFTRRWVGLGGLVALTLGTMVYVLTRSDVTTHPEIKSIAVLPLQNLSGDSAQEYFADGMTETLIAGLAKVRALRVTSRTSVMQYKKTSKGLPEIARQLAVDAVVEGSVQRFGERVKVTARLIHARTERQLWTETYERDLSDVLALQGEIARAVVQEIQVNLTPHEQKRLARVHPIKPQAYDEYLRGRYYANRQNKADNEAAISALERSVAADPTFASAHAELAQAYVWKLHLFTPEKQWEEKAFVSVEKALSLDPDLADAYLARGRLLWTSANRFPHEKAIQEYRRALSLNPSLDEAQNQLALVYNHIGAFDQALQELQKAVAINPNNALAQFRIGQTFMFQGKYEKALTALRQVPTEVNPALVGHNTALALLRLGKRDEAAALLEELLRDYPKDEGGVFSSVRALLFASAGEENGAEREIAQAIHKGKDFGHFHHTAYHIACAYALMKRVTPAITWLQAAAENGFPCYSTFEDDPYLDNLRKDARFVTLIAKLKEQWEPYRAGG